MDGLILAIDLGKFNSVCCWYDTASRVTITPLSHCGRGAGGEGLRRARVP